MQWQCMNVRRMSKLRWETRCCVRSSSVDWFTWQKELHHVGSSWQRSVTNHHQWPDQRRKEEKIFLFCHLHFPRHIRSNSSPSTLLYRDWHVTFLVTAFLIISYILQLEVVRSLDKNEDGRSFVPWNTNGEQVINNRPIIGKYGPI